MAEPPYLRQYETRHWNKLTTNEQQVKLLEVERTVRESQRTLRHPEPSHVVKLGSGYTYMWDVAP